MKVSTPLIFKRPNPPTKEAVEKARFIDKTYKWAGSAAHKTANTKPTH